MRTRLALLVLALLSCATPALAANHVDSTGAVYSTDKVVVPLTFPVIGPTSYTDSFLACRGTGCSRHHLGQDLMGPKMSPLVAACTGTVVTLQRETHVGGGNYVGIACDTGAAAGWSVMYLHVNNDTPGTDDGKGTANWSFPKGIAVGVRVLQGQLVGWRGDSGDAETVGSHLHVELRKGSGWDGVVYNAIYSLRAAHHIAAPVASGPHPDGTLLRTPANGYYMLQGGMAYGASADVRAADALSTSQAVSVSWAEMALYPSGGRLQIRSGALVSDPAGTDWRITDRSRFPVTAEPGQTVIPVAAADLAGLAVVAAPDNPLVPGLLVSANGRLWQVGDDGQLHGVGKLAQTSWGLRSADAVPASGDLSSVGADLGLRDGTLVTVHPTGAGVIADGSFHRLWDRRELLAYGYAGKARLDLPASMVRDLPVTELAAVAPFGGSGHHR